MRGARRARGDIVRRVSARSILFAIAVSAAGCESEAPPSGGGPAGSEKTAANVRASRRAYDGAPPVIPHPPYGASCVSCHAGEGLAISGVGFAPPQPHEEGLVGGKWANCRQCHVPRATTERFAASTFAGLAQDLRSGARHHALAPPVMPHAALGRENCFACHTGPGARDEIRCSHPERANCRQCHLPQTTRAVFRR